MAPRPTFSLRFTHAGLRDMVRAVADRDGISQNELLEQAAEHEVVVRGLLMADELEAAAVRLRTLTAPAAAELIAQSLATFVQGEANPEPLRPYKVSRPAELAPDAERSAGAGPLGAVAAFGRK